MTLLSAVVVPRASLDFWGRLAHGDTGLGGSIIYYTNQSVMADVVRVLRLAAADDRDDLRSLVTGLPVAGVEGSLRIRFGNEASLAGRGVVRGKTGTLREVQSLAGLIRTRDGSVLVYAFVINRPKNAYNARVWLERVTAVLGGMGLVLPPAG